MAYRILTQKWRTPWRLLAKAPHFFKSPFNGLDFMFVDFVGFFSLCKGFLKKMADTKQVENMQTCPHPGFALKNGFHT